MMREIPNPRQNANEYRRVFTDEYFDLYIWLSSEGLISGFQLCYEKGDFERALTWTHDRGFTHEKVDDGEKTGDHFKMKPILLADGVFNSDEIKGRFREASGSIDKDVSGFVLQKLEEYSV